MRRFSNQYPLAWKNEANPPIVENFDKWYPYFSQSMGAFVPPDFYSMICFITRKIHRSSIQYPIAWKNAANPPIGENLGNWYPDFSQSMDVSLQSDSHLMIGFITRDMHRSSHQYSIALESKKTHLMGRVCEIGIRTFAKVRVLLFHQIFVT